LSASLSEADSEHSVSYIGKQASLRKRNLTILPCDNGKCIPNYDCLKTDISGFSGNVLDTFALGKDEKISTKYPYVSLRNYVTGGNISILGASTETKQRDFIISTALADKDINDVTVFDIPNLYYGEKIHPGSFTITEKNMSGSGGKVSITLSDDGKGSLYRSDSETKHAKWASVGNIFYDEGIVLVKNSCLTYFGMNDYEMKFKGEQTTHVLTINAPAPRDLITSSSNPTYKILSASANPGEIDNNFVYISGVNIHDENLNVIMRTNLAQPVVKRRDDEFLFKVKMDF
jgi:hypothetical protein